MFIQLDVPKEANLPYQVICEHCGKTIYFTGENGDPFYVLCEECLDIK